MLSMQKTAGKSEGSLTVEAALVLPLFLFFVILLALPMDLLDTHRCIQMILESTGREISRNAFLLTWSGDAVTDEEGGDAENADPEDTGDGLLTSAAAAAYLSEKIARSEAAKKITQVNTAGCRISADGEKIDLRVSYRAKMPFPVLAVKSIPMSARSLRHGWVGKPGESGKDDTGEEDEEMVYVGRDSTRYHRSPSCHYLSNDIHTISAAEAGKARNKDEKIYKPCSVCGAEKNSGVFYVLPNGEKYHTRPDCSSLSSYVRKVPLSSVAYLGPCSYCGGER